MASDALPAYSVEDTIGGIQGLLSESLEEWTGTQDRTSAETVPNEHLQQSQQRGLQLPITQYPTSLLSAAAVFYRPGESQPPAATNTSRTQLTIPINREDEEAAAQQAQRDRDVLQAEIILSFHDAVRAKNIEVVTHLVNSGVCSPDVTDDLGTTPLIAAVEAGDVNMVRCLLQLGAQINALAAHDEYAHSGPTAITTTTIGPDQANSSRARHRKHMRHYIQRALPLRTPLMVAAQLGNLVIVRFLLSPSSAPPPDYSQSSPPLEFSSNPYPPADDAIISPTDGQIALRLAALHGHKDIVRVLPIRRGGGWQRWRHAHARSLRNIKRAGQKVLTALLIVLYEIPRFFVWSCPKHLVVLPAWEAGKWCYKNKGRFKGWCARQVRDMPARCVRGAEAVGRGVKKLAKAASRVPRYLRRFAVWIYRKIKQIPSALRIALVWLVTSLKALGGGILHVISRALSVLHTTFVAVLDLFRNITARDVLHGLKALIHAVFVDYPRLVYEKVIVNGGKAAWEIVKRVFGTMGEVAVWIGVLLVKGLVYIPKQLARMVLWMGSSLQKGVDEVRVWVDPKRV